MEISYQQSERSKQIIFEGINSASGPPEMQTVPNSWQKSCTRGSLRRSSFRHKASFARTLLTSSSSSGSFARTLSTSSSSSRFTSPSFFSPEPTSTNELLTVFQSAPLVYQDENGKFQPVGMLDFDRERKDLTKALSQTEIKVDLAFDFANTDRLFNFLAQGKGRVLHYSGHGHPP
jgi:hypothetical protein